MKARICFAFTLFICPSRRCINVSLPDACWCGGGLLRDRPDALGLDDAQVEEKAVVLEIVGDDDAALLLPSEHILNVVLNIAASLNERSVDVAGCEIDDVEAVLQVADDADNFIVLFLLLERGNKLRHAERRDIKPLTRQRVEVMQTGFVSQRPFLEKRRPF